MAKLAAFALSFTITLSLLVFPGQALAKQIGFIQEKETPLIRAQIADKNGVILGRTGESSIAAINPQQVIGPTILPTVIPTTVPPTKKPTATQIPSPTPSAKPTAKPTSKPLTPTSTPKPTPKQEVVSQTSDVQIYIMNAINAHRKSKGLSEVKTDSLTCAFAKTRAEEIAKDFNHDGFRSRIDNKTLPYPSYSQITENIAMNGNYKDVVNQWINSAGHRENMEKDTPFVCVESNGSYYAYEGWKP